MSEEDREHEDAATASVFHAVRMARMGSSAALVTKYPEARIRDVEALIARTSGQRWAKLTVGFLMARTSFVSPTGGRIDILDMGAPLEAIRKAVRGRHYNRIENASEPPPELRALLLERLTDPVGMVDGQLEVPVPSLRDRRLAARVNLRDAARMAGLSHVRFGEIERGVREPATADELASIERMFAEAEGRLSDDGTVTLGQIGFTAYTEKRGGKNHDGSPTPPWEALGDGVRAGWEAAGIAIRLVLEHRPRVTFDLSAVRPRPTAFAIAKRALSILLEAQRDRDETPEAAAARIDLVSDSYAQLTMESLDLVGDFHDYHDEHAD